jgi:hypothetical protein
LMVCRWDDRRQHGQSPGEIRGFLCDTLLYQLQIG